MSFRRLPDLGLTPRADAGAQPVPWIGPALRVTWSPLAHKEREGFLVPEGWDGDQLDLFDPAPPDPGLVPPRNLSPATSSVRRYGFRGMTSVARRQVRETGAVLDPDRKSCSFWTVSLPDDALAQLAAFDLWPAFVRELRRVLVRRLRSMSVPPFVVGVVELHPQRSRRHGLPLPHLHFCYRSKRSARAAWAMGTAQHDEMVARALGAVGVVARDLQACSKVEPIRRSVGGYLAKYMSKGSDFTFPPEMCSIFESCGTLLETWLRVCLATGNGDLWRSLFSQVERVLGFVEALVPRQWWLRSAEAKRVVDEHCFLLPQGFADWLVANRDLAPCRGLVSFYFVDSVATRAPPCWCIFFDRFETVPYLLGVWAEDCSVAEEFSLQDRQNGCLHGWN